MNIKKRVIFGKIANSQIKEMQDLNKTELYMLISIVFLTLFFGFYPDPLLNTVNISVDNLIENYQSKLDIYSLN